MLRTVSWWWSCLCWWLSSSYADNDDDVDDDHHLMLMNKMMIIININMIVIMSPFSTYGHRFLNRVEVDDENRLMLMMVLVMVTMMMKQYKNNRATGQNEVDGQPGRKAHPGNRALGQKRFYPGNLTSTSTQWMRETQKGDTPNRGRYWVQSEIYKSARNTCGQQSNKKTRFFARPALVERNFGKISGRSELVE